MLPESKRAGTCWPPRLGCIVLVGKWAWVGTSPLSRECRPGCTLSLSSPEAGGRGDDSLRKGAVGALRFLTSLSPAHDSLRSLTHPCQFLKILRLFLAAKVVLAQGANIQVLARGCQTTPQTISAHAVGNTGVRNSSSHPNPRPATLPCFPQFYQWLSACSSSGIVVRSP